MSWSCWLTNKAVTHPASSLVQDRELKFAGQLGQQEVYQYHLRLDTVPECGGERQRRAVKKHRDILSVTRVKLTGLRQQVGDSGVIVRDCG